MLEDKKDSRFSEKLQYNKKNKKINLYTIYVA